MMLDRCIDVGGEPEQTEDVVLGGREGGEVAHDLGADAGGVGVGVALGAAANGAGGGPASRRGPGGQRARARPRALFNSSRVP